MRKILNIIDVIVFFFCFARKALKRFNSLLTSNSLLRAEIDNLRNERERYENLSQKTCKYELIGDVNPATGSPLLTQDDHPPQQGLRRRPEDISQKRADGSQSDR